MHLMDYTKGYIRDALQGLLNLNFAFLDNTDRGIINTRFVALPSARVSFLSPLPGVACTS